MLKTQSAEERGMQPSVLQNKPRAKVPVCQETTTQRIIIQSAPGMRHPLANYMASHTVNDMQHTATNGVLCQPVHRTATY